MARGIPNKLPEKRTSITREEELEEALAVMLAAYEEALRPLPAGSWTRAVVEEAFARSATIARKVLG